MPRYKAIRKYVEHYEHIVEADSEWEAEKKVIDDVISGDIGKHLPDAGDSYVETVNLIEGNQMK